MCMLYLKSLKQWSFTNGLFAFCALWTLVQMTLGIAEYMRFGWVIPKMMPFAYFVILAAYVGRKEFDRWADRMTGRKQGEIFFFAWWTLLLVMLTGNTVEPDRWAEPWRVLDSCLYVLTVFILSDVSKALHHGMQRRRHRQETAEHANHHSNHVTKRKELSHVS